MVVENQYRIGVGAIILNSRKQLFVGKRLNIASWQLPQGGIDENETFEDAIYREIDEETSIKQKDIEMLAKTSFFTQYDFPPEISTKMSCKGQRHKWFLFNFIGNERGIDVKSVLEQEFSEWKWSNPKDVMNDITEFKRGVYKEIFEYFHKYLEN